MLSMTKLFEGKLNWLEANLPQGLVVDAAWLAKHGFSTSLRSQYLGSGRLEQPAHRVYRRPHGSLDWQQVVVSLQSLLGYPLAVGGRTALDLQGFAHYLAAAPREIHLYGSRRPPTWLKNLSLDVRFAYHNDRKLFRKEDVASEFGRLEQNVSGDEAGASLRYFREGDRAFVVSTPERAILELLDELPRHESFEQADKLMASLPNLSPRRLASLLRDCHSVKVKRLFFFFADRHRHAWLKRLNKDDFDLGRGKRMLVRGGKLDSRYQITVPEDLNAR